jgi:hypothetical protein
LPAASVELTEVRGKVVFQEHPALARFGRFDATLACVLAQDGGRHVQEARRLVQVEGSHALLPIMAAHPDVVATCLGAGLPVHVALHACRTAVAFGVVG